MKIPKTFPELKDQDEEAERLFVQERVLPLRKQGKTLREIAKIVVTSYEQVRRWLNKYGDV
jgi:transposase